MFRHQTTESVALESMRGGSVEGELHIHPGFLPGGIFKSLTQSGGLNREQCPHWVQETEAGVWGCGHS